MSIDLKSLSALLYGLQQKPAVCLLLKPDTARKALMLLEMPTMCEEQFLIYKIRPLHETSSMKPSIGTQWIWNKQRWERWEDQLVQNMLDSKSNTTYFLTTGSIKIKA